MKKKEEDLIIEEKDIDLIIAENEKRLKDKYIKREIIGLIINFILCVLFGLLIFAGYKSKDNAQLNNLDIINADKVNLATLPPTTISGGKLDNFDASGLIINATNPMDLGDKVVKKFNNYSWSSGTFYLPVLPINQYYKFVGTNNGTNWTILFIDGYGNQLNYVNLFNSTGSSITLYNSDLTTLMSYSFATEGITGTVEIWVFETDDIAATEYTRGYSQGYRDGELVSSGVDYENGYNIGYGEGKIDGYDDGFIAGEDNGKLIGYGNGYDKGLSEGTSAWGVMFSAFMSTFGILYIELFPGLTLGMIIFFPLVLGLFSSLIGIATFTIKHRDKE